MAQAIGGTGCIEGEQVQFDLRAHLSKYNVPNRVLSLLKQDSITVNELSLFRIKDLDNWCDENQLRAVERTRFINAVKLLPNSQANKPDSPKVIQVPVFLGNEEKEQLNQFDEMKNNVKNIMNHINELQNKLNVDKVIGEINSVCDDIQSYVEKLRKNLLAEIKSIESTQSQHLSSSNKSFENLLQMIEKTNDKYKKYLTNNNNNNDKQQCLSTKREIQHKISKCKQEYDKIVLDNANTISQKSNIVSLNCSMRDIKEIIENNLITIKTTKYNDQFIHKLANVKFSNSSYSICQFDLQYTKLTDNSTIDCDNKHIKIGSKGYCYSMILPDTKHVEGYSDGQHCFRMYYKNPKGPNQWLFFGIYQYGIVPQSMRTQWHKTSWGIGDGGIGEIYCNGYQELDKSNMSFLYSLNENQIDMLIDLDKRLLSYSIVDDNVKNRKYTFQRKFNANVCYTVHLNFEWSGTEVQVAKIGVDMFGKNKKLVQWEIQKY